MSEKKRASSDKPKRSRLEIRAMRRWISEMERPSYVTPKRSLVEIKDMLLWIGGTLAAGALVTWIMWYLKGLGLLKATPPEMASIWEVFFAVFGLIYAIIVGLFIVESYRRWGELSSIIHSEINAIGDIHDCLKYFDDSKKNPRAIKDITNELRNYVKIIMEDDWETMKDPRVKTMIKRHQETGVGPMFRDWFKTKRKEYRIELFRGKAGIGIRPIIDHVDELKAKVDSDRHALGVIIDRICEITTHRVNRLELAEHGLKSGLYVIIIFMSLVIVGATLMLPVGNEWVHMFIVFSTTVAIVALGLLLFDLDHPFTGFFKIEKESLNDIEKKLE